MFVSVVRSMGVSLMRKAGVSEELVEGDPVYSEKCLTAMAWAAKSFAQSKTSCRQGQSHRTLRHRCKCLTVQEVGAIHLYSQDGPFYHRLNTLLNAKKNRGKRLQVNSRAHLQKKKKITN